VTKTQSAGPISGLEHRATRVLHCTIVTRAAVLMFPLLQKSASEFTDFIVKASVMIGGSVLTDWFYTMQQ